MAVKGKGIVIPLIGDTKPLRASIASAKTSLKGLGKAVAAAGVAAGVAGAAFGASAVKDFAKFDKSVREVATLLGNVTDKQIKGLSKEIQNVSKDFGLAGEEVAKSFYDGISAGVPRENIDEFARQSAKLAIAGSTDIGTSVDLLTSAMNAYKIPMEEASRVSDIFFTVVKQGKTTIGELGAKLSNLAPVASAVGAPLESVTAWLAQLTLSGTPTAEATTQVRAALAELNKGQLAETFFDLSGKTFKQFTDEGGKLQQALQMIGEHAEETGTPMFQLASSVEAVQAVLGVTGANAEGFANVIDELGSSSGATEQAFKTMSDGIQTKLDKMRQHFEMFKVNVGDKLVEWGYAIWENLQPAIDKWLPVLEERFGGLIERFQGWAIDLPDKLAPAWEKVVATFRSVSEEFEGLDLGKTLAGVFDRLLETAVALAPAFLSLAVSMAKVMSALTPAILEAVTVLANAFANIVLRLTPLIEALAETEAAAVLLITAFATLKAIKLAGWATGIAGSLGVVTKSATGAGAAMTGGSIVGMGVAAKVVGVVGIVTALGYLIYQIPFVKSELDKLGRAFNWFSREALKTDTATKFLTSFKPAIRELTGLFGNLNKEASRFIGKQPVLLRQSTWRAQRMQPKGSVRQYEAAYDPNFQPVRNDPSDRRGHRWRAPQLDQGVPRDPKVRLGTKVPPRPINNFYKELQWDKKYNPQAYNRFVKDIKGRTLKRSQTHIPQLASGGIVREPTLAMVGERGPEAVVPLDRQSNMGVTNNFYITVEGGLDSSAEIGRRVAEALRKWQSRKGGVGLAGA